MKDVLECLLPLITSIINKPVSESAVPLYLKKAHLRSLIKKSNLPFLSKNLEKMVATHFESHLSIHKLHDDLQSAYREDHSTETALLKVHQCRSLRKEMHDNAIFKWSDRKCPILDQFILE